MNIYELTKEQQQELIIEQLIEKMEVAIGDESKNFNQHLEIETFEWLVDNDYIKLKELENE